MKLFRVTNVRLNTMNDELHSMSHNRFWEFVKLPDEDKPIYYKWVFKTNHDA